MAKSPRLLPCGSQVMAEVVRSPGGASTFASGGLEKGELYGGGYGGGFEKGAERAL